MAPDEDSQPGPLKAAATPPPAADDDTSAPLRLMLSFYSGWYELPNAESESQEAAPPPPGRWTVEKKLASRVATVMCVVLVFTCACAVTVTLFAVTSHAGLVPDVLPRLADVDV